MITDNSGSSAVPFDMIDSLTSLSDLSLSTLLNIPFEYLAGGRTYICVAVRRKSKGGLGLSFNSILTHPIHLHCLIVS
jgi:hypothetical protein